ncbi:MAG: ATP-dependent RecD-like DNA helicase [Oscillospiraceae bacterium]|nr:ATP-dependent RecD-like DNA helicase [Oscillospiraceae bacterium]
MDEQQTLIGTVAAVVFQNEENGYAVVRVVTDDGELVTVVGCIPCAAPGEQIAATGGFITHPQHGEQFSATEVERHLPATESAIIDYLASGVVRGIGPATAQKLVDRFGPDTLDVLENAPEELRKLRGFTDKRVREITEGFREQMGLRRLMSFLTHFDLPVSLSVPLYRRFGTAAMEMLRRNPYLLVDEPFGVDFAVADEIALALGGDASCRTEAGVLFELSYNESSGGHIFLPRPKLVAATAQLLDVPEDEIEKALDDLIDAGRVAQEPVANVTGCYLSRCLDAERYVALRLRSMLADKPDVLRGAKKAIDEIEREQGIEYAPLQRRAVELAAEQELLILTGGPGTGKTTSVRAILTLFERMGLDVQLAAPTGRAAKRMGEVCGRDAQTIHRMLGMSWDEQTGRVKFTKNEKDPIKADAVIVDEMSMVDLALMRAFLAALRPGCRLVLVGDPDQLPSVGAGNVFSDLIRSGRVRTVALTEVFRQAQQSAIIRNAHAVNEGRTPELQNTADSDFFFLPRRDPARLVDTVVELCKTRLPDKMGIPAGEIQVLTPTRKGATGTAALNRALQAALNPPSPDKRERQFADAVFREGDRVMQTRNDYDVIWEREDGTAGTGVFNGDVGQIVRIDPGGELLTVAFDDRVATYTADMLSELDIAYAMTVHKAQGSEYRGVVFVAAPCAPGLEVRGVLYTAITRARELLIVVGDDSTVRRMTENDKRQRRYSGLRWRLAEDNA